MPGQPDIESLSREHRIILATKKIESDPLLSVRRAAAIYNAAESTLRMRRAGRTSRRDSRPNSSELTKNEEEAIIEHITELEAQGLVFTLGCVRNMANQFLSVRDDGQVGRNWTYNLVRRRPELKSRLSR